METLQEIKARIIASNPSKIATINFEEIELSDAELNEAIEKRSQMEYEQQSKTIEIADAKAAAESKLEALGLTSDDFKALGL